MLLTLLQLHILLAAVPALSGWPTWAIVPAPMFAAHVQRMGVRTAQAPTVAVRSAAVHNAPPAPTHIITLPVMTVAVHGVILCPAHAPRAP